MAFLIPENIPSRNDIPRRLQSVARALREMPDEITVWMERPEGGERKALALDFDLDRDPASDSEVDPYLVLFDPAAGIAVIEAPSRQALARLAVKAINDRLDLPKIRSEVQARVEDLSDHFRSITNSSTFRSIPIKRIIALPESSRRRVPPRIAKNVNLLTREDFDRSDLRRAIHSVLGGDPPKLTADNRSTVRATVNPRITIADRTSDRQHRFMFDPPTLVDPSQAIAVLDRRQERLAMSLGPGYRMIRGVAGSGKTLVLTYRARHIADHFPTSRILMLCYNRVLSLALKKALASNANIVVKTVDGLAFGLLPKKRRQLDGAQNDRLWRQRRIDAMREAKSLGDSAKYDLVLVDEAQDLESSHLDLAYTMLKADKDHFIMALDSAQNIYRRRMTWNPPGVTARGRTTVLRRNYRNTAEILDLGMGILLSDVPTKHTKSQPDDNSALVRPQAAERSGPEPQLIQCANLKAEAAALARMVQTKLDAGVEERHILVMSASKFMRSQLLSAFEAKGINSLNAQFRKNHDKVITKASGVRIAGLRLLKGLEFPHVFLGGANHIKGEDLDARKLLYVAITRATETLTITFSGSGSLAKALRAAQSRTN